ncbi:MAG: phage virion morphogenesis protein [Erythrobacter sp.]|nr:phage virion morphogenesis protein [Erythrobacter sp.]NCQ62456.1 phage virion morphogenesis protein [Alphaproteobacteria bacterium]
MFDVEFNAEASRNALARAMRELENMTPVYQDIADYLVDAHRQRFIEGRDPDGKPWAPKKQSTLDRYRRLGYGNLRRPLIGPGRALSRQIASFVSANGVVIGSALIYSRVMQEGAAKGAFGSDSRGNPIPWGTIPARRWLGLSQQNEAAIVEIVDEHLGDAIDE